MYTCKAASFIHKVLMASSQFLLVKKLIQRKPDNINLFWDVVSTISDAKSEVYIMTMFNNVWCPWGGWAKRMQPRTHR